MFHTHDVLILLGLLVGMLGAIRQMGTALDNEDLERFSMWTCIAAVLAFTPAFL
jgi:hypothetical protein